MWENFATYLGTQIFAGWTTPKSHLVQHLLSEGGQHQMLQEKVQEHLNRLCFHNWGKHLLNFQLFLLLLYVDLFSFYSTKIKQRCLFQTLDIIAQSTKCFLPVIHWVTITNPKNLTPTPAFSNSSAYFQQRSPQSGKWYGNDHSPSATAVKAHGNLPCGFEWGAGLFQQLNTNTPQSSQRGHTGGVGQAGPCWWGSYWYWLIYRYCTDWYWASCYSSLCCLCREILTLPFFEKQYDWQLWLKNNCRM